MIFTLINIAIDTIYVLAGISAVLWLITIVINFRRYVKSKKRGGNRR